VTLFNIFIGNFFLQMTTVDKLLVCEHRKCPPVRT